MTYVHDLDEIFDLIETAERAAEICLKIARLSLKNRTSDDDLRRLAGYFRVTPRSGHLA